MAKNNNFRTSPLYRFAIDKQSPGPRPFKLANLQIAVASLSVVILIGLAILYGQLRAPFYVQDIRWESRRRFCRVYVTLANPRRSSINASMAIQAFEARKVTGIDFTYTVYDLQGIARVPVKLAANETRLITYDVVFSDGPSRCSHVEVQRLAAGN